MVQVPRPWTLLEELVGPPEQEEQWWGGRYLAWGTKP
jgi:hypothetical protein